ncbi:MAG: hypothetical protein ABIO63_12200, partial [Casimicrobiaceae bacterium]
MDPYVSFVIWGRNDGYTDDYLLRVNRATTVLALQLEQARVNAEIIISEWNPPPGRALLLDVLDLPPALNHVGIRGVVAGPQFHAGFKGAHERPLHNSEAVNVGIRRARGRFLSPKASDTFFSPQAIEQIARQDLEPDTMYRMDRWDVSISDGAIWTLDDEALLAELNTLPSRRHAWIEQMKYWQLRDLHTNACGDFTMMATAYWHLLRGFPRDKSVLSLDSDSLAMHAAAAHGLRECRWPDDCTVLKPGHGNLNNARIVPVWTAWQHALDKFLRIHVSLEAMHWFRSKLNYPRRKVR